MDETYRPTVRTQAELEAVWRHLMGPFGYGGRSLWMLQLDENRQAVPHLIEIAECDELPDPGNGAGLVELLRSLDESAPGGTFAFLVSRPGRGVHESDRMWARFVHEAGTRSGVSVEMTHLATDAGVVPLPPDDFAVRSA